MFRIAVYLVTCAFMPIMALSQKTFSIQFGGGGTSISWLSITAEAKVLKFERSSIIQSLAVSTGYGIPMLNATFLPLDAHIILFQGNSHLDVTMGANVQVKYKQPNNDGWKDLQTSAVNPTGSMSYRYDPEDGGFCFHIGLCAMYAVNDSWFIPMVVSGIGWSF